MIKQFLHKISSIALAVIVLFSTVSFTIEKHYCGDFLVDVAVFSEAEKCASEVAEQERAIITKKMCCKDTVDLIEGQKELQVNSYEDLSQDQIEFVVSFVWSYTNALDALPERSEQFKHYIPPLLTCDRQILDQVFLI